MYKLTLKIAWRNIWKNKQFKNIDRIYSVYENDRMSDKITTNRSYATLAQLAATALQTIIVHKKRECPFGALSFNNL